MSSKAAARYAQSLIDFANEKNKLEEVKTDMETVIKVCADNRELELLLQSPIIKTDQKNKVLTSVFEKSVSDVSLKFIQLIVSKKRERMLMDMAQAFIDLYKENKGIITAHVTSAKALSDAERKEVMNQLKGAGKEVELVEHVDASLIGGLKIRVGDRRFDASIRKKLNELKHDLSK